MKHTLRSDFVFSCLTRLTLLCVLTAWANAADLHPPAVVEAGQAFSIHVQGSGQATFYLVGPDHVVKRNVSLGGGLQVQASDVRTAGRYQIIVCDSSCSSTTFDVKATQPERLSFFLHPSRVPVSSPSSIDATAFVFDQYFNLILTPAVVDFRITPASGAGFSRQGSTRNGVTWMRMDSTPHEGTVRVTAAIGKTEEARVIQQVAAEVCGLRMKTIPSGNMVTVETDPVRDCSGNPLPDSTVVSNTVQRPWPGADQHCMRCRAGQRSRVQWEIMTTYSITFMSRKVLYRLLASAGFVMAISILSIAQSTPEVHLDAEGLAPRPIEELTGMTIVHHYAQAWRDLEDALQASRSDALGEEFTGVAKSRFTQRIAEQQRTGVHVRIVDHGHHLKALFYSTDGTAMQLVDQAQLEIQTFDGNKLLDTQNAPHEYMVLMTPGADRWYIRDLEEVPAKSN
jgi:hypothetical protein